MQLAAADAGMLACILLSASRNLAHYVIDPEPKQRYSRLASKFSILALRDLQASIADDTTRASDDTIMKTMAIGIDSVCAPPLLLLETH
jgi:hypothetical protein